MKEFSVLTRLPNNGQRCQAFGYKTFCCKEDKEENREWHDVIFSFYVHAYKIKDKLPEDIEESIIDYGSFNEHWEVIDDEEPKMHLIGVTKWRETLQSS